jgi:hypothetical protein
MGMLHLVMMMNKHCPQLCDRKVMSFSKVTMIATKPKKRVSNFLRWKGRYLLEVHRQGRTWDGELLQLQVGQKLRQL